MKTECGLHTMGNKENKYRCRVEQKIADKRTETADRKRLQEIHQDCSQANQDVVQIQVSTRKQYAERTECDIHGHKQACYCQLDSGVNAIIHVCTEVYCFV